MSKGAAQAALKIPVAATGKRGAGGKARLAEGNGEIGLDSLLGHAGLLLQLAIQQVAYHVWLSSQAGVWWPLVQFLCLQYVVALRFGSSPDDPPGTPDNR